jgi:hypothetical protein
LHHHGNDFQWKSDPYEYEFERSAIDLILGSREIRLRLSDMAPIDTLEETWQDGLEAFRIHRRDCLFYPE